MLMLRLSARHRQTRSSLSLTLRRHLFSPSIIPSIVVKQPKEDSEASQCAAIKKWMSPLLRDAMWPFQTQQGVEQNVWQAYGRGLNDELAVARKEGYGDPVTIPHLYRDLIFNDKRRKSSTPWQINIDKNKYWAHGGWYARDRFIHEHALFTNHSWIAQYVLENQNAQSTAPQSVWLGSFWHRPAPLELHRYLQHLKKTYPSSMSNSMIHDLLGHHRNGPVHRLGHNSTVHNLIGHHDNASAYGLFEASDFKTNGLQQSQLVTLSAYPTKPVLETSDFISHFREYYTELSMFYVDGPKFHQFTFSSLWNHPVGPYQLDEINNIKVKALTDLAQFHEIQQLKDVKSQ